MTNLVFFGHHKCASTWMTKIFHGIQAATGFRMSYTHQPAHEINLHINARAEHLGAYSSLRGIHLIRDPRDVVVSGYFSHLKTHPPGKWTEMLELRERLQELPKAEGLFLEMDFLEPHFRDMAAWNYAHPDVLELRYEEVTARDHLDDLFLHLGLSGPDGPMRRAAFLIGRTFNKLNNRGLWPYRHRRLIIPKDIQRRIVRANSFEQLSGTRRRKGQEDTGSHYRKGVAGDWRNHFEERHKAYFRSKYGGLLQQLGYEKNDAW